MQKILFFILFVIPLWPNGLVAQTRDETQNTKALPYRLFLPSDKTAGDSSRQSATNNPAEQTKKLLVFLHGSGERGSDNEAQLKHGRAFFERLAQDHNTLVLVPQCPENLSWHNGYSNTTRHGRTYHYPKNIQPNSVLDRLEKLIDSVAKAQHIESGSILLGGLSMGGMGTLELLRRRPEFFNRAFVICGGAHPAVARQISQTPIWFFHGAQDQIVDPKQAVKIYRKRKRKGIEGKLTLYPGVDHNSWDLAFQEKELITWLMH